MREQKKLLRRDIERNTGARCLVMSHVHVELSYAHMFRLSLRSAPQHRTHAGEQFGKRKRFDQVIVCAQLESFHTVAHTVASGKKENRRAYPIAPELRDHFPAVFMWKHDIDDKKIKLF